MRALRIALWSLAALVAVLAAGLGISAATFDPTAAFARVATAVHRQTGRDLAAGDVRLRWSLPPALVLERVTLSNPPGLSRPMMAEAAHAEARLRLAPLLAGQIRFDATVTGADVRFEQDNWQFAPSSPPPPDAPGRAAVAASPRLQLDTLDLVAGQIAYADARGGDAVQVPALQATRADDGTWSVQGTLAHGGDQAPFSVSVQARSGQFDVFLRGGLTFGPLRLGELWVRTPGENGAPRATLAGVYDGVGFTFVVDLDRLPLGPDAPLSFQLAGQIDTPDQLGISAQGTVAHPRALAGVDARLHASSDDVTGTVAPRPKQWGGMTNLLIDLHLVDTGGLRAGVALRAIQAQSDQGDLRGDLALNWSGRPSVRGTLASSRINVDAIAPASAPAAAPPTAPPTVAPAPPPGAGPAAPFALLRRADADIAVSAANVSAGGLTFPLVAARILLRDGRLQLDPMSLLTPGGPVGGAATLNASIDPPRMTLDLHGAAVRLDLLTPSVHGVADLDVSLAGSGSSVAALAAGLSGHAGLALIDGDVSNALLSATLAEPLRAAHLSLEVGGRTAVSCLAVRADAAAGVATIGTLLLDSARVDVQGGGTADLAGRSLALQLRPTLRLGGASVATPLLVSGPFAHPAVRMDPQNGRVGLSIGSAAEAPDCGPALLAARGRAGPLPTAAAPADPRPRRPLDLLRGFVR